MTIRIQRYLQLAGTDEHSSLFRFFHRNGLQVHLRRRKSQRRTERRIIGAGILNKKRNGTDDSVDRIGPDENVADAGGKIHERIVRTFIHVGGAGKIKLRPFRDRMLPQNLRRFGIDRTAFARIILFRNERTDRMINVRRISMEKEELIVLIERNAILPDRRKKIVDADRRGTALGKNREQRAVLVARDRIVELFHRVLIDRHDDDIRRMRAFAANLQQLIVRIQFQRFEEFELEQQAGESDGQDGKEDRKKRFDQFFVHKTPKGWKCGMFAGPL